MVKVDTIEGVVDGVLWCHYDIEIDLLYLRLTAHRDASTVAEETDEGMLLLRREDTDEVAGMTIVNWWKRFGGGGALPDSIHALERAIDPWTRRFAA